LIALMELHRYNCSNVNHRRLRDDLVFSGTVERIPRNEELSFG